MKSINRKLNELENKHVLQPMVAGSSKLDLTTLPEAEQLFLDKAREIVDSYKFEDLNDTQKKLMVTAFERVELRMVDLFNTYLQAKFGVSRSVHKQFILKLRFWYFLHELGRHML